MDLLISHPAEELQRKNSNRRGCPQKGGVPGWCPFYPSLGAALGQKNSMKEKGARKQVDPRVYPRGRTQVWGAITHQMVQRRLDSLCSEGHRVSEEPAFGHLPNRLQQCQSNHMVPL